MKFCIKFLFIYFLLLFCSNKLVTAQILATYTGSAGTSTAVVAAAANETVGSLLDVGFGSNTPCTTGGLRGITVSTTWTTYSASGPHLYFQIWPNSGYTLTVTNYWAWTRKSATGPTLARLAYSLDGGATWTSDMDHAQAGCSGSGCCGAYDNLMNWLGSTGPAITGITSTNGIIVAIFPFAPGGSTGTFQVQYMEVDGTVNTASTAPAITTNPVSATICSGTSTSFTSSASGIPTPTYQWQRSTTGIAGPWTNITAGMDGGIYGTSYTTSTLTVAGASLADNGYAYRLVSTNTAGTATSTPALLIVLTTPMVAPISGASVLCVAGTSVLADASGGGTWSSSNTGVAAITASSGIMTGTAAGTATITYTVTNICGTSVAVQPVTVTAAATPVSGTTTICIGTVSTLSNGTPGGTWITSDPTVATVAAAGPLTGFVIGLSQGTTEIYYAVSNACGTTTSSVNLTVSQPALPVIGADSVCTGAVTALTDNTTGGVWTASNSNLSISAAGNASGLTTGLDTVTYTVSNVCGISSATKTVFVNQLPDAGTIYGPDHVCAFGQAVFSSTVASGNWASSNATATLVGTGIFTANTAGLDTIVYTVTNTCGSSLATHSLIINPTVTPAVTIVASPAASLCPGLTVTLDPIPVNGGSAPIYHWYVNGLFVSASPLYAYTPANNDLIHCELINNVMCPLTDSTGSMLTMTVSDPVVPGVTITSAGGDTVCAGVPNTFTANIVNGGLTPVVKWSVNWVGMFTGSNFTYTPANGDIVTCALLSSAACTLPDTASSTMIMSVLPFQTPQLDILSGTGGAVCEGNDVTVYLNPSVTGWGPVYYWSLNGVSFPAGLSYTYRPSSGDTIKCVMVSNYHCPVPNDTASAEIGLSVDPVIVVTVTSASGFLTTNGVYDTLTAHIQHGGADPAYQWYRNGHIIPGANNYKLVRNDFHNKDSISCMVTTGSGTPCQGVRGFNWGIMEVAPLGINNVSNKDADFTLVPNPNKGEFAILVTFPESDRIAILEITDMLGKVAGRSSVAVEHGIIAKQVVTDQIVPNGIYMLHIITDHMNICRRFEVIR